MAKKNRRDREIVASCPGCKTLETLWFIDDVMTPTKRFVQRDGFVYHDCGSDEPCRLFAKFTGEINRARGKYRAIPVAPRKGRN